MFLVPPGSADSGKKHGKKGEEIDAVNRVTEGSHEHPGRGVPALRRVDLRAAQAGAK